MKKQITLSFIINITGLSSLFIIDLMIARLNDDLIISSWAVTKSIIFIGVNFVLLGLDQSVIRLKSDISDILSTALVQFLVLSLIITFFIGYSGYSISFWPTLISLFLFSIVFMYHAEYRLHLNYSLAQFSLNGWKFLLLISLVIFGFKNYTWSIPVALFIVLTIVFYARNGIKVLKKINIPRFKTNLITGLHYFLASISITLTLYIDQLLLRYDGKITESSILFSHATFFVSPNAILIGFGGFLLAPYLKRNPEKKIYYFKKYFPPFIMIIFVIVLASYFFGNLVFSYVKPGQEVIPSVAIALSTVAFFRYLYIIPSSYVGSFASNKQIRKIAYINLFGIIIYILTYIFLSRFYQDYIFAIVSSLLIAWLLRLAIGFKIINEIFKINE